MMRKQLLLFILLLPPMVASADDSGKCGDNVNYYFEDVTGTLTISGTGEMYNYGFSQESPWYNYRDNIRKVIIENGVTVIANTAFVYCSNLISVTLPNSLISIGVKAFAWCI